MTTDFQLYYWPMLPGRGEFIRLIFEHVGVAYRDVGRLPGDQGGGVAGIQHFLNQTEQGKRAFALPVLVAGELVISQMPNICLYLGEQFGLLPTGNDRWLANQIQLTICDVVDECHDTHHPLSKSLYYEDQKEAARHNAQAFLKDRLPRWMQYFENLIGHNDGRHLLGAEVSMVDLQLFQLMRGIQYAFPKHYAQLESGTPGIRQLISQVTQARGIREYLDSERCIEFNEFGIFRYYPELESLKPL